jgi:hypothetical protein
MRGVLSFDIVNGLAWDQDGKPVDLKFCETTSGDDLVINHLLIDDEPHRVWDCDFYACVMVCRVEPASIAVTVGSVYKLDEPFNSTYHRLRDIAVESGTAYELNRLGCDESPAPPAATPTGDLTADTGTGPTDALNYQTVCDAFNRLAKLESEGHHGGQTFYVAETVWALLTAQGVVIDLIDVDSFLNYFGRMFDGSFNEMNAESLAGCLETWATKLGGEV